MVGLGGGIGIRRGTDNLAQERRAALRKLRAFVSTAEYPQQVTFRKAVAPTGYGLEPDKSFFRRAGKVCLVVRVGDENVRFVMSPAFPDRSAARKWAQKMGYECP